VISRKPSLIEKDRENISRRERLAGYLFIGALLAAFIYSVLMYFGADNLYFWRGY